MKRKPGVLVVLALGIAGALLAATLLSSCTRQAEKMPRIGVVGAVSPSSVSHIIDAFRQGLSELGYLEGQNIVTEYRFAGDRFDQLPELAVELVRLKVRVIVAGGDEAIRAARDTTDRIPIVMAVSNDAVGTGLVDSLARPGGNITGLTAPSPELSSKRLELLKEAAPGAARVGVLWNPVHPLAGRTLRETEVAARSLGVQLQVLEVRDPNEIESAFAAMTREHAGAAVVLRHPMFIAERTRIADLARRSRLPVMYELREFVEAGGLMSYGVNLADSFRRAASYVDKILKGAKPSDLPVEQPRRFELVINVKTAKALGLPLPQSLLLRADHVIH